MVEAVLTYNNTTKPSFDRGIRRNSTVLTADLMTLFCGFIASIGFFCNGLFVGWSSNAFASQDEYDPMYSSKQIALAASTLAFGAFISPLLVHRTWQWIGTKITILVSALMMMIAWICLYFSAYFWVLLSGRFVGGLAVGAIHFLIPLYISDIRTSDQKSLLNFMMHTQFASGIFIQFAAGLVINHELVNILSLIAPIVYFFGFLLLPESPRYLCWKGNTNAAHDVIHKFKDMDDEVEQEFQLWSRKTDGRDFELTNAFAGTFRLRLIVPIFGLVIFEQVIGVTAAFFFMQKIFSLTVGEYLPGTTATLCALAFVCSIPTLKIFGCVFNEKSTLIWTSSLMGVSLFILGLNCIIQGTLGHKDDILLMPVICYGFVMFLYAIGPYQITWNYIERLVPKSNCFTVRSLTVSASWFTIFAITRIWPRLIDIIGAGWLFWHMSAACVFFAVFVSLCVPNVQTMPNERQLMESVGSSIDGDATPPVSV